MHFAVTCPLISSLPNGMVKQDVIPNVLGRPLVNTVVQFDCFSGYRIIGSTNVTCLNDGMWSDLSPICDRKTDFVFLN